MKLYFIRDVDNKGYYINPNQISFITKYHDLTEIRIDGTIILVDREIKSVIEYLELD